MTTAIDDERLTVDAATGGPEAVRQTWARGWLLRPELGAAAGAALVWLIFAAAAGETFRGVGGAAAVLNAAAPLGILAVAVGLLMIGGEFDLSVGSVIGLAGMVILLLTRHYGWPLWPAIGAAVVLGAAIGFANGYLVVRTRLPSFIVTLGTLFIVRGLAIAVPRMLTRRTQLGGLDEVAGYAPARAIFASDIAGPFSVSIAWWLALAALATWVQIGRAHV